MRPPAVFLLSLALLGCPLWGAATQRSDIPETRKPRIAFFPLAGNAKDALRDRAWLALRLKLDRGGVYEVIDGPRMLEVLAESDGAVDFTTAEGPVRELGKLVDADVLVWGDFVNLAAGATLRLRVLDLRQGQPRPQAIEKVVAEATDLRFAAEQILETLPGVARFEHPSEQAVSSDADSEAQWARNPNMVVNGDFSDSGCWKGIYQAEKYSVTIKEDLPAVDKVCIYRLCEGQGANNVLAMNLSRYCAENNGMACLSDAIRIQPDTRYRLSFRYKSDGPRLHVFVKGYTQEKNIKGETVEREIYRRQVPPSGATGGRWVTVADELNPQHVAFPVQVLRVDLYAYLSPGVVMFDDVVLKAVGRQTRKATDEAIKRPVTRPASAQ